MSHDYAFVDYAFVDVTVHDGSSCIHIPLARRGKRDMMPSVDGSETS